MKSIINIQNPDEMASKGMLKLLDSEGLKEFKQADAVSWELTVDFDGRVLPSILFKGGIGAQLHYSEAFDLGTFLLESLNVAAKSVIDEGNPEDVAMLEKWKRQTARMVMASYAPAALQIAYQHGVEAQKEKQKNQYDEGYQLGVSDTTNAQQAIRMAFDGTIQDEEEAQ